MIDKMINIAINNGLKKPFKLVSNSKIDIHINNIVHEIDERIPDDVILLQTLNKEK